MFDLDIKNEMQEAFRKRLYVALKNRLKTCVYVCVDSDMQAYVMISRKKMNINFKKNIYMTSIYAAMSMEQINVEALADDIVEEFKQHVLDTLIK